MNAEIKTQHKSELSEVLNFDCKEEGGVSLSEYNPHYSFSFIRKGGFGYQVGRRRFDLHGGLILLEKPGFEYKIDHRHRIKDQCTIFQINRPKEELRERRSSDLDSFFQDFKSPAKIISATPRSQLLHLLFYRVTNQAGNKLSADILVVEILREIGRVFRKQDQPLRLDRKMLDRHIETIDRAKDFINSNFQRDLTLTEIARRSFVSEYHLCRLFKRFTSLNPYQYLIRIRLEYAALLLRETSVSVTEVCFDSGFNGLEHFSRTFAQHFGQSPTRYRLGKSAC